MFGLRRATNVPATRIEPTLMPRPPMKISREAVANARGRTEKVQPYAIPAPMPGVVPRGAEMAMDDGLNWAASGSGYVNGFYGGQTAFYGYPFLSELAQRPEYRRITETIAREMTRKWIKIHSKGKDDKTEKISRTGDAMNKFRVQEVFREAAEHDGYFGKGQIYLDTDDGDDPAELMTPLKASRSKIKLGGLKRIRAIEPIWTYPGAYNTSLPLHKDFYRPPTWYVMGVQVDASRLIQMVGREVPDLLKPAYMFGGLSMSQIAREYIDRWLKAVSSVNRLIENFSTMVLMTDMSSTMSGDSGSQLAARVELFNQYRSNDGTFAIDKLAEDIKNVAVPLGSLDRLQAQNQEQICSITGIPLVKYTGISPSGLNASGDVELDCWDDFILAYQEHLFRRPLKIVMDVIQLTEFGEIDPDITFSFEPLRQMTAKEQAEIRKLEADTAAIYVADGIIAPEEQRTKLASAEDGAYDNLDMSLVIEPPEQELDPNLGGGVGKVPEPGREEGREAA